MSKEEKPINDHNETKLIRELAAILDETKLSEIEIEKSGLRIKVARTLNVTATQFAPPAPSSASPSSAAASPVKTDLSSHPGLISSPMVGTAYVSPSPGAAPFVKVGDMVTEGQTVLIIEAMKTMNQISATKSGRITQILINDAQPVEFGEPLMVVE